jgi:hypothetical protein
MSKIDLSKAKLGDKFRTREGYIVALKDIVRHMGDDVYLLTSPSAFVCVLQDGKIHKGNKASEFDLVEQVFDDEKDTTDLERIDAMNQALKEFSEKAAEREKDLQRRQEVVELAERLLFMNRMHDAYNDYIEALNNENLHTLISFPSYILQCAEDFIKYKNQYLKEGKL